MTYMSTSVVASDDVRVASPFLTPNDVSVLTEITASRAYDWARKRRVTTLPPLRRGWPTIPLVGLAEYATFTAWHAGGLPIHEVLEAAAYVRREIDQYGFLSSEIMHDGVSAYLHTLADDGRELERIVNGQMAFFSVVEDRLEPFVLDEDGLIFQFRVEQIPGVVIDPRYNAGRMMFESNSVPVFAVDGLLRSGEPPEVVADEYGLTHQQVQDVIHARRWLAQAA